MSRKILGLDINDHAVSAVIVRGGIKGNRIEDHRFIPFSAAQNDEPLSLALDTIASEMDLEGATCIASLPASLASYRNMDVPFKERKKLRQILPYELESNLPYPPEEVTIDFKVLEGFGGTEQHHVFTAAVQKESVGFYLSQLKAKGIEPQIRYGRNLPQAVRVRSEMKPIIGSLMASQNLVTKNIHAAAAAEIPKTSV